MYVGIGNGMKCCLVCHMLRGMLHLLRGLLRCMVCGMVRHVLSLVYRLLCDLLRHVLGSMHGLGLRVLCDLRSERLWFWLLSRSRRLVGWLGRPLCGVPVRIVLHDADMWEEGYTLCGVLDASV